MTTGITAALHFHSLVQAPPPDVEQARDATQKIDAVKVEDAPPEKQQSLPEMIDDFMAKSNAIDKKITEFEKDIAAHADVTADLQAAQAALATYMTEHPDLQGDIDTDEIMVYLPETSPLRTGETAEVSVRTLMNKYKVSQKGLQLPEMPKFVRTACPEAMDTFSALCCLLRKCLLAASRASSAWTSNPNSGRHSNRSRRNALTRLALGR